MMRYKVVPARRGLEMQGWGIWDEAISPRLHLFGYKPALCSLDGENPLLFRYMTGAYNWLAECEKNGLDLEAGDIRADVYGDDVHGGVVIMSERGGEGQSVNTWPLARQDD
jgi:hypothetical protein